MKPPATQGLDTRVAARHTRLAAAAARSRVAGPVAARRSRLAAAAGRHTHFAAVGADRSRPVAGEERHSHPVAAAAGADHSRPAMAAVRRTPVAGLEAGRSHPAAVAAVAVRRSHLDHPDRLVAARSRPDRQAVAPLVAPRAGFARRHSLPVPPSMRAVAPPLTAPHAARSDHTGGSLNDGGVTKYSTAIMRPPSVYDESTDDDSVRAAIPHVNATFPTPTILRHQWEDARNNPMVLAIFRACVVCCAHEKPHGCR